MPPSDSRCPRCGHFLPPPEQVSLRKPLCVLLWTLVVAGVLWIAVELCACVAIDHIEKNGANSIPDPLNGRFR